MRILVITLLLITSAAAQQQPIPLTDWRAAVDSDLSKLPMTRDAHGAIIQLMQAYERQAQTQKLVIPPADGR